MTPRLVSVAIVNWNTRELLAQCLASLPWKSSTIELDVVVCDNASRDGSQAMVRRQFPQVRLLCQRANVGFVLANNMALAAGRADYCLMLNSDAELLPDSLERLVETLAHAGPGVGAVGPRLLNSDGSYQAQLFPFPRLRQRFRPGQEEAAYASTVEAVVVADPSQPVPVQWLVGAAVLTRRETLWRVGALDERSFMWYDDVAWGRRLARAGLACWFVPAAQVRHHERKSAARVDRPALNSQMLASEYTYLRLNDGLAATVPAVGLRLARAGLRWLLSRGRDHEAARRLKLNASLGLRYWHRPVGWPGRDALSRR